MTVNNNAAANAYAQAQQQQQNQPKEKTKQELDQAVEEFNTPKPDYTSTANIDYEVVPTLDTAIALNKLQKQANKDIELGVDYPLERPYIQPDYYEEIISNALQNTLKEQLGTVPDFEKMIEETETTITTSEEKSQELIEKLNKEILDIKEKSNPILFKQEKQEGVDVESKDVDGYIEVDYTAYKVPLDVQDRIEMRKDEIFNVQEQIGQLKESSVKEQEEFPFSVDNVAKTLSDEIIASSADKIKLLRAARTGILKGYQEMRNMTDVNFPDFVYQTANKTLQLLDEHIASTGKSIIDNKV